MNIYSPIIVVVLTAGPAHSQNIAERQDGEGAISPDGALQRIAPTSRFRLTDLLDHGEQPVAETGAAITPAPTKMHFVASIVDSLSDTDSVGDAEGVNRITAAMAIYDASEEYAAPTDDAPADRAGDRTPGTGADGSKRRS